MEERDFIRDVNSIMAGICGFPIQQDKKLEQLRAIYHELNEKSPNATRVIVEDDGEQFGVCVWGIGLR